MKSIQIPCQRCRGTGSAPLRPRLAAVMACVGAGGITSAELHARTRDGTGDRAAAAKLTELLGMGLLRRAREGSAWRYHR